MANPLNPLPKSVDRIRGLMTLKRPVNIKVIVTPEFRERLLRELERALDQLDREEQQLEFQSRRVLGELSKTSPKSAHQARTQWEQEKERHADVRRDLMERKNQTLQLESGTEYLYATVEGAVEIAEGDLLFDKLKPAEIIVKDDRVVAIR